MSFANRLMHETESFFGAVFDLVMGRGGDGVYGSSAENYYRPEEAQTPVINIHADAVTMNAASVQVEREAAPTQDVTQQQNAQEAAFYDAMRQQQEAEQEQQFSLGR